MKDGEEMVLKFRTKNSGRRSPFSEKIRQHLEKLEVGEVLTHEDLASELDISLGHVKSSSLHTQLPEYTTVYLVRSGSTNIWKRLYGRKETIKCLIERE